MLENVIFSLVLICLFISVLPILRSQMWKGLNCSEWILKVDLILIITWRLFLKKANKKYHALARVCNYMDTKKRRVLMKAFITSQFSYCPLVWMFHSRTLNNRINKIHERALRLVYKNETFLSFDDLLKRDRSVSIHQKNLQILATEIYKTKNDLGPKIMKDTFHFIQKPYNLRNDPELQRRKNRTVYFGTENISSLASKIWELIPSDIRSANSLGVFKEKIKFLKTDK